jgi:hypothetical protein
LHEVWKILLISEDYERNFTLSFQKLDPRWKALKTFSWGEVKDDQSGFGIASIQWCQCTILELERKINSFCAGSVPNLKTVRVATYLIALCLGTPTNCWAKNGIKRITRPFVQKGCLSNRLITEEDEFELEDLRHDVYIQFLIALHWIIKRDLDLREFRSYRQTAGFCLVYRSPTFQWRQRIPKPHPWQWPVTVKNVFEQEWGMIEKDNQAYRHWKVTWDMNYETCKRLHSQSHSLTLAISLERFCEILRRNKWGWDTSSTRRGEHEEVFWAAKRSFFPGPETTSIVKS